MSVYARAHVRVRLALQNQDTVQDARTPHSSQECRDCVQSLDSKHRTSPSLCMSQGSHSFTIGAEDGISIRKQHTRHQRQDVRGPHLDSGTEDSIHIRNIDVGMDGGALATELRMVAHADKHIQVSRLPASAARITLPAHPQAAARVDACTFIVLSLHTLLLILLMPFPFFPTCKPPPVSTPTR